MRIPYQSRLSSGANMTPMIDVVFLLIIFFLVSSHLARQEHRLPVELPFAEKFSPLDPEKQSLTIRVDLDRQIYVSGDDVDISQLRQILADYQASRGASAAIRIRTDSAVQYQYVEPILREAAKLGIADAAIAVQEGDSL